MRRPTSDVPPRTAPATRSNAPAPPEPPEPTFGTCVDVPFVPTALTTIVKFLLIGSDITHSVSALDVVELVVVVCRVVVVPLVLEVFEVADVVTVDDVVVVAGRHSSGPAPERTIEAVPACTASKVAFTVPPES